MGAGAQFKDALYRHDALFPELARVISTDYVLVDSAGGARLYRRRDLTPR